MALSGLQIQKLLPKTNCKECGSNTCLAFAMKLAAKKAELAQCPYASEEAKRILGAASEPPVKELSLGPEGGLKLGGETVLCRHEKSFVHQTALAVNVNDTDAAAETDATHVAIRDYTLVRVGEKLRVDMVAVTQRGPDPGAFVACAAKAWQVAQRPLVLVSGDAAALADAAAAVKGSGSVLVAATPPTADALVAAAKANGHALALAGADLNELAALAARLKAGGFNELLLHYQTYSPAERFQTITIARRMALRQNYKPTGYPGVRLVAETDSVAAATAGTMEICKYGGICVLPRFDAALLALLMTLRMNIYTDPQKPIQVEPKVYPIGEPSPDSPVFVTTNFSLTFFIVSGEIENSGRSAWLVVPDCEGMSVLTAWAAGKFSGASIGRFVKSVGLEQQVRTRQIIIPGYVAQISGELEESLPGWKVQVGPQEAADLESFIKARL